MRKSKRGSSKPDRPKSDDWMDARLGLRNAEGRRVPARVEKAVDEIGREKRRIRRDCHHVIDAGPVGPHPFECGVDTGKRPLISGDAVRNDRQSEGCEARWVAVRVDDDI